MKGELTTVVIDSTNRSGGTAENARYDIAWDNILPSGKYKLHWRYMEIAENLIPPPPPPIGPTGTLTTISTIYPNHFTATPPSQTIVCSTTGEYMSVCASGVILSTSNSGTSFTTNTFTDGTYSVGMNSTGQYQVAISTGNPSCSIYVSTNYGVTWTNNKPNVTVLNNGRWFQSIAIDNTGQYMYCGGGGGSGLQGYYSKDFGTTWTIIGSILNRYNSTMNTTTKRFITLDSFSNNVYNGTLTDAVPAESLLQNNVIANIRLLTSDGGNNVVAGSTNLTSISYSSNGGTIYTTKTIPELFQQILYGGSVLWGSSATTIYKSINHGTTWTTVLTGLSIKSFASTLNNNRLYISYTTGEVVATNV